MDFVAGDSGVAAEDGCPLGFGGYAFRFSAELALSGAVAIVKGECNDSNVVSGLLDCLEGIPVSQVELRPLPPPTVFSEYASLVKGMEA